MALQSISRMMDQRIAELQQARELLVEFEALVQQENIEPEAQISSRKAKMQIVEGEQTRTESPSKLPQVAPAALANVVNGDGKAVTLIKVSRPSATDKQSVVKPKEASPLGGVVPVGPVVVTPREHSVNSASVAIDPGASHVGRPESSLEELAREVAARMGISPSGVRLN